MDASVLSYTVKQMIRLSDHQIEHLLLRFDSASSANTSAHSSVWRKRLYAAQLIFDDEMASLREAINTEFPNHCIAFDVLFESDAGKVVDYHCDYESLGPFEVKDAFKSIINNEFITLHFNLTKDGGSLTTLDWPVLSFVHYLTIVYFGIFSFVHTVFVALTRPVFWVGETKHTNEVGFANVFNNMCLHSVSAGAKRVSYVVRLVERTVCVSQESIRSGIGRSSACEAFEPLTRLIEECAFVRDIDWRALKQGSE